MRHFFTFVERTFWGTLSLALGLVILFAALHVLRTNAMTSGNIIGQGASWVGAHAQNY